MSKYGGGSTKCVRCSKIAFQTEQVSGPGGFYHAACFTCTSCNKKLDSMNVCDNAGLAYCKTCHSKLFGQKLYKQTDVTVPKLEEREQEIPVIIPAKAAIPGVKPDVSKFKGTDICPTCEKKVYFAEAIAGPGSTKYHRVCFKCSVCRKMLDSSTMAERENVLYCGTDYTKLYGSKGNRGGSNVE